MTYQLMFITVILTPCMSRHRVSEIALTLVFTAMQPTRQPLQTINSNLNRDAHYLNNDLVNYKLISSTHRLISSTQSTNTSTSTSIPMTTTVWSIHNINSQQKHNLGRQCKCHRGYLVSQNNVPKFIGNSFLSMTLKQKCREINCMHGPVSSGPWWHSITGWGILTTTSSSTWIASKL